MAALAIKVTGLPAPVLTKLAEGVRAVGRFRSAVGTPLVYAAGQETGRYRSGRLARRRGGAWYSRGALQAVLPTIGPRVAAALPKGGPATSAALRSVPSDLEREGQRRAPVDQGNLRDSYRVRSVRA